MMPYAEVNFLAVFACALLQTALGALYYSPLGPAKPWIRLAGVTEADAKNCDKTGAWKFYLACFALSFVTLYVLAHLIFYAASETASEGAIMGFWLWLGFIVPAGVNLVLFERRPLKLFFINAAFPLIALLVSGAILAVWI